MIRLAVAVAIAWAAWPAVSQAQRIGVYAPEGSADLALSLRAELRSRGYEASLLDPTDSVEGLDAAAWVDARGGSVRFCVLATQPPRCERIREPDRTILVIRVVESLRAQLDDGGGPEAREPDPPDRRPPQDRVRDAGPGREGGPSEPRATRPSSPPQAPADDQPRVALGLGPAVILPARNLSAGMSFEGVVRWSPLARLMLEAGGWVGVVDPSVRADEGHASVRSHAAWLGAGLDARLGPLRLGGGAQVGVLVLDIGASASAPFRETPTTTAAALLAAVAFAGVELADRVSLELQARLGGALPAPAIAFADRRVGTFGAPLGTLRLGLLVAL